MNVDLTGQMAVRTDQQFGHGRSGYAPGKIGHAERPVAATGKPDIQPVAKDAGQPDGASSGVLRLLQAGHFKGVADLRLRINFHEQLAQLQNDATREAMNEPLAALPTPINDALDGLADGDVLTEEQKTALVEAKDAFNGSIETFAQSLQQATIDLSGAPGSLQTAFDTLVASLQSVLVEPADSQPDSSQAEPAEDTELELDGNPSEPIEPLASDEPAFDVEAFFANLAEAFANGLSSLTQAMSGATVLPDLSPPSDNGVAYEKFAAVYRDLQDPPASPEQESASESVDTTI